MRKLFMLCLLGCLFLVACDTGGAGGGSTASQTEPPTLPDTLDSEGESNGQLPQEIFKEVNSSAGLGNEYIRLYIAKQYGGITILKDARDESGMNFVIGPDEYPTLKTLEGTKWLGDVDFDYRFEDGEWLTASTAYSSDSRTMEKSTSSIRVRYDKASDHEKGVRDFAVTETYTLDGEELRLTVEITNTGDQRLEFGGIGLPLRLNSIMSGTNEQIYDDHVYLHPFVAHHASYFYAARNSGNGRALTVYPLDGTPIEYQSWKFDPDGCSSIYPYASRIAEQYPETAYWDTTSLWLAAGETKTLTFGFRFAEDIEQVGDELYEAGLIDITAMPGMVTSTDLPVSLDLHTLKDIEEIQAEFPAETEIRGLKASSENHTAYQISFSHLGQNKITVTYDDGKTCTLLFFVTEPLEQLIEGAAAFIADNQQQTDPTDPCYMAFLPWDMHMYNLKGDGLLDAQNDTGNRYLTATWWHFGGDEIGFAPALFLSEKNVYKPDDKQIKQLVDYINIFIWDGMTEKFPDGTYRLHRGKPWDAMGEWEGNPKVDREAIKTNQDCWRSYNYLHVINTYYNMYRIVTLWELDIDGILSADEYLKRAYDLAYTFFTAWMYPAGDPELGEGAIHLGNMGETMLPFLEDALRAEGMMEEADWLAARLKEKAEYFTTASYPYSCEGFGLDTCAYEAIYAYARYIGDDVLAERVTQVNRANRGQTPVWYLYGSDCPGQENKIRLRYMTQVGGWALLNETRELADDKATSIRLAYGSYLAGWALINTGYYDDNPANKYASGWYYQGAKGTNVISNESWWAMSPVYNGLVALSGESALGYWAGLKMACTALVEDELFGLYCYGGELTETEDSLTVVPKDGVRQRLYFWTEIMPINVEAEQDRLVSVTVRKDGTSLEAVVESSSSLSHEGHIMMAGLKAGQYKVHWQGAFLCEISVEEGTEVTLPVVFAETAQEGVLVIEIMR